MIVPALLRGSMDGFQALPRREGNGGGGEFNAYVVFLFTLNRLTFIYSGRMRCDVIVHCVVGGLARGRTLLLLAGSSIPYFRLNQTFLQLAPHRARHEPEIQRGSCFAPTTTLRIVRKSLGTGIDGGAGDSTISASSLANKAEMWRYWKMSLELSCWQYGYMGTAPPYVVSESEYVALPETNLLFFSLSYLPPCGTVCTAHITKSTMTRYRVFSNACWTGWCTGGPSLAPAPTTRPEAKSSPWVVYLSHLGDRRLRWIPRRSFKLLPHSRGIQRGDTVLVFSRSLCSKIDSDRLDDFW
jgi:hypothetical protein